MSSQQELLDAINTISDTKDKSFDTPATVLRVENDTVWVHIDGGADETPVLKTVDCSEGETVQVRISNGSAFLVGNASSPPTDDTTAQAAQFVAEQAEIEAANAQNEAIIARQEAEVAAEAARNSIVTYETWYMLSATEPTQPTEESHTGWSTVEPAWSSTSTDNLYFSIRTVKGNGTATWSAVGMVQSYADLQILKNAIISTVASDYVAQGDSNVTSLSSTMLQNTNGVNIYNGTLAVGDSYAHIDGDSFDIKEVTTAGSIDDTNDLILASFAADETIIGYIDEEEGGFQLQLSPDGIDLVEETPAPTYTKSGWSIGPASIMYKGVGVIGSPTAQLNKEYLLLRNYTVSSNTRQTKIEQGNASFSIQGNNETTETNVIGGKVITEVTNPKSPVIDKKTVLEPGKLQISTPYYSNSYGLIIQSNDANLNVIDCFRVDLDGNVSINGELQDTSGNNLLDEWTSSSQVNASNQVTFTGLNDNYGYELYCQNKLIGISAMTKTGSGTNVSLTFTVTGAASGDYCKLRILK